MRQIGIAMHQFANTYNGDFPSMAYFNREYEEQQRTGKTGSPAQEEVSWIATLVAFTEDVDAIRLCPDDIERVTGEALSSNQLDGAAPLPAGVIRADTSYAMNGYLRRPEKIPPGTPLPIANAIRSRQEGMVGELYDLVSTHATLMVMESVAVDSAAGVGVRADHLHCPEWFEDADSMTPSERLERIYPDVAGEVAVERHIGNVANYLYADGHVETIGSETIAEWCSEGFNFVRPPQL